MRLLSLCASNRTSKVVGWVSRSKGSGKIGLRRASASRYPESHHNPSLRAKAFATIASLVAVVAVGGLAPITTTLGTTRPLGGATLTSSTSTSTVRDITTVAGGVGVGQGTSLGQSPENAFVDPEGNVYVADDQFQVVRKLSPSTDAEVVEAGDGNNGGVAGFGGDGGPATGAQLFVPAGGTVDANGNVVFTDSFNNRVRVVAGATGTFYGVSMTAGDIYTVAGEGTAG
jgi:hypothetical protein